MTPTSDRRPQYTTIGVSADGALTPHAFRARTRTTPPVRTPPRCTTRGSPHHQTPDVDTATDAADLNYIVDGSSRRRRPANADRGRRPYRPWRLWPPGGAGHGAVVTDTAAEGSPTPPAVAARTRTCHAPMGTRVAMKLGTSLRATATNAALPLATASITNPAGAGPVGAGVHVSSTRLSATSADRPVGGCGRSVTPTLTLRRFEAGLRPAPFTATSSTS